MRSSYLLAVQTALVSLDGDEFLATDGETVGEGIVGGGESSSQGVDVILGKLKFIRYRTFLRRFGRSEVRTSNPGEPASRPEKSAARIPALSN